VWNDMKDLFAEKMPPYICAPLTGRTEAEVLNQLEKIVPQAPDLIEWRADFFNHLSDAELVGQLVQKIKSTTDIPLLFTIRAEHEGGEKIRLGKEEIVALLADVCAKTDIDLIDYETSNDAASIRSLREIAKENGKKLILSFHDFKNTPESEELLERAKQAEAFGADIAKLAVMPHSKEDVLRLLEVTKTMDDSLEIPVATMSMGELGAISRVIGWAYGSVITFGVGAALSAPGQVPMQKLKKAIQATQELVPGWK